MADDPKPDAKPAGAADAKPAPKAAYDGPLDFTELAAAEAVADETGGTVEHVGTAFHVAIPE